MEIVILAVFSTALIGCAVLDISLMYALLFGLILFSVYALKNGFTLTNIFKMSWSGIKNMKSILLVFVFIGVLTASWRASGTLAYIIYYASSCITPSIFVLATFILCSAVSFLVGSSFAAAATIGAICVSMGSAMGADPAIVGGAMLSGSYFGDRCSPMSSTCLLISNITRTAVYDNLWAFARVAFVPFILTCAIYFLVGVNGSSLPPDDSVHLLLENNFNMAWVAIIPAVIVIMLSLFRIDILKTMGVSILAALIIGITYQGLLLKDIPSLLWLGYASGIEVLAPMVDGGGITSMALAFGVVAISSCYAGIFGGTQMLVGLKGKLSKLGNKITSAGEILCVSVVTNAIACNQPLAVMLTKELSEDTFDKRWMAVAMADTAGVIGALIPWSINAAVPLSSSGAPALSILFACYLYLLPLWFFVREFVTLKRQEEPFAQDNPHVLRNVEI